MATLTRIKHKANTGKPKELDNQGRANPNRDVYGSSRWTRLSKLYRQANPLCVSCKDKKIPTPSKVVDHIIPINDGHDPWDEANWQALCVSCHQSKSSQEGRRGGMSPLGQ